jgi:hydroxyacylglutathione hydrolase
MALLIDLFAARKDNIGYLVHDVATGKTAAIDAPDFDAIEQALARRGWALSDIFITHHHTDHVEALQPLKRKYGVTVTGPRAEADKIPGLDVLVAGGDGVTLGESDFYVIDTPGHTLGHLVYYDPTGRRLFSADTLFSLGVGRIFEGKPEDMWAALVLIRSLPDDTLIFCGHEYTLDNAAFASTVDPDNVALKMRATEVKRMRAAGQFTVPVSLALEKATNPFLRADQPALREAMALPPGTGPAEVFAALRAAKDVFKP